ncbi:MAG TPA: indolepyruvate oxidoreductase subunit beta [Anaerolineae bacterium]|nr:indolepyruvate oxidoreductase subunit beta [Anaerolineae bacterium]
MAKFDFLLVGVGGQGVLLAGDILAQVGLRAGYDVKKAEVHGMAQRGGSVVSHVRWAEKVLSPLIGQGEADFLLALEKLEALRHIEMLRPDGTALVNDYAIPPLSVSAGDDVYPDDEHVRQVISAVTDDLRLLPGTKLAEELGSARAANAVMLGALSALLDVPPELWLEVIAERVPERYAELNRRAFLKGREAIAGGD